MTQQSLGVSRWSGLKCKYIFKNKLWYVYCWKMLKKAWGISYIFFSVSSYDQKQKHKTVFYAWIRSSRKICICFLKDFFLIFVLFLGFRSTSFLKTFLSNFHYLTNFDVRNYFKTSSGQRNCPMKAVWFWNTEDGKDFPAFFHNWIYFYPIPWAVCVNSIATFQLEVLVHLCTYTMYRTNTRFDSICPKKIICQIFFFYFIYSLPSQWNWVSSV